MGLKFNIIGALIRGKLERLTSALNKRRQTFSPTFHYVEDSAVNTEDEQDEKKDASTQFLSTQKNKLSEVQQRLEGYVKIFPVLDFNNAKCDLNLIKSYLIPQLVNEEELEPTIIKKASQFVFFKFANVQFLELMNFLGGATSLDSSLKAFRSRETKSFLPYEWFDSLDKLMDKSLPLHDDCFSRLRNYNLLEGTHSIMKVLILSIVDVTVKQQWKTQAIRNSSHWEDN